MTEIMPSKRTLRKMYFTSLWGGLLIAYIIMVVASSLSAGFLPNNIHTYLGALIAVIITYLLPALLNLMFFMAKDGKKIFIYIPVIITAVLYISWSCLTYKGPKRDADDVFYMLPLSIVISQIVMLVWVSKQIKKEEPSSIS